MKLATLSSPDKRNRFGQLVVVSADGRTAAEVPKDIASNLLEAVQNWKVTEPKLREISEKLQKGGGTPLDVKKCLAPLPNCFGFFDGSAFLSHVVRARRARGDQMPESAKVTPLMYQGVADNNLAWNAPLDIMDPAFGGDFEGEFAAITTDVPKGVSPEEATEYIALFTMFNDVTYREIVKTELETKFGFLQSKPNSHYAPFAVTPDEFGDLWDGKRLSADLQVELNGKVFGKPNGREMHFTFGQLIAHAGRTRPLSGGTIVGTGTISNESAANGFACLTEKRFQEVIDTGKPITPWLKVGDHVQMNTFVKGQSIFGAIDQIVEVTPR